MRDISSPLGVSIFDGDDKPSRTRRKNAKKNARNRSRNAPKKTKSKYGGARGERTKEEKKGPVYCKPGRELDKSCKGSEPTGAPKGGRD